ncbi:iron chelate uptake ABC transporter family permease subunit [Halomonas cibimaris]|uniref:Iron chelate uptake ABC transporter family permease subunit n=1 Tax=Halomonas cibimaris TaxID=657012 RepID=A0ABP7LKG4_9GAMM
MAWLTLLGDYTFQNVVMGAALLGIISGTLGSFAVLRGQSLLGDAISHASLPGVCLGFIVAGSRHMGSIIVGAMITGGLAALLMLALTRMSRLKTDAALGACLSLFFAVGVVLLTYIQGMNNASQGGLDAFLFGQAAATLRSDVWFMGGITLVALAMLSALWKQAKLVTFDPEFARTLGMPVTAIDIMLTAMITLAVVVGLQMVGVVLMAAMIVAPAVAARQWSRHLGGMVVMAAGAGVVSGIAGATLSTLGRGLATGPLIILSATAIVLVSLAVAPGRGLLWESLRLVRQRWTLHTRQILYVLYQTRLEQEENDPGPGFSRSAFTALALYRLRRRGLLTLSRRAPGRAPRQWRLTPAGVRVAQRVSATFNAA